MRFYQVTDEATIQWFGNRADAHVEARKVEPVYRRLVKVCEVNVVVDKATVLAILNREPVPFTVLRTWQLTARGGLLEITAP